MRVCAVAAMAVLMTGCATSAKFEAKMNGLMFKTEPELVAALGPPQSVYNMAGDRKVLTYSRSGQAVIPGAQTMQPVVSNTQGNVTVNSGFRQSTGTYNQQTTTYIPVQGPSTTIQMSCTVNFRLNGGVVEGWSASGNRCVSE